MLTLLQEQEKSRNMLEWELEHFMLEADISESEIYQVSQAGVANLVNFTVIKGEIADRNFSYILLNKDSNEYEELKNESYNGLKEFMLNNTIDMTMVNLDEMHIRFDRTDDCNTFFILTLPWTQQSIRQKFNLEAELDKKFYQDSQLGKVNVENAVVKDLCWIRTPDTAYKGICNKLQYL